MAKTEMQPRHQPPQPADPTVMTEAVPHTLRGSSNGKQINVMLTPNKITQGRVTDLASLKQVMQQYQSNAIRGFTNGTVTDRRWHMERMRPALRFYCKQYKFPVPAWLQGNGPYDQIPAHEHKELFGNDPLAPKEFRTWQEFYDDKQAKFAEANQQDQQAHGK